MGKKRGQEKDTGTKESSDARSLVSFSFEKEIEEPPLLLTFLISWTGTAAKTNKHKYEPKLARRRVRIAALLLGVATVPAEISWSEYLG